MNHAELPNYPVVTFLARKGAWLALFAGLLPFVLAVVACLSGAAVFWLPAGALGSIVLWGLVKSYVEVLQILVDALMPR